MIAEDERLKILNMVKEGKLTPEEAISLLEALEESDLPPAAPKAAPTAIPPGSRRWFRVRVTDTGSGKVRANIRVPLSIVSAGLKIGKIYAPEVEGLDAEKLMEIIQSGDMGQIVDVLDEKDGEHVEVYIE
jgi:hypothetical protein